MDFETKRTNNFGVEPYMYLTISIHSIPAVSCPPEIQRIGWHIQERIIGIKDLIHQTIIRGQALFYIVHLFKAFQDNGFRRILVKVAHIIECAERKYSQTTIPVSKGPDP